MKPRHWYHCTTTDHGDRFVAERRWPTHPLITEPPVPRLCVCKTVTACFAAVLFLGGPVHVYRTANPRRGIRPRGVWDAVVTGERWLIPPVEMVKVAVINSLHRYRAQHLIHRFHSRTGQCSNVKLRIAQYSIAIDVLGGEPWERRLLSRFRELCGIDDPRAYIRQQMEPLPLSGF